MNRSTATRRPPKAVVAALVAVVPLLSAGASGGAPAGWSASGSATLELRYFPDSPANPAQLDGAQPSLLVEPELRWRSEDGRHRLELTLFGRRDSRDGERSHADVRVASYRYVGERFELLAGVDKVFWGVAESRHLVDVVNQTDGVEDVDEEEKLGQPMLRLALDRRWGRWELFVLPGFRERTFPGSEGRLRPPLPVDTDRPLYGPGAEDRIDLALRWSHYVGAWDLGAHFFHGVGREPVLVPAAGGGELRPLYRVTTQMGVDVQRTRGPWLGKLEAIVREGQGATFAAAVAGCERSLYGLGGSSADLGVLLELLWDDRDPTAPPTVFDRDLFAGLRLAANDVHDTTVLAGVTVDLDHASTFGLLEASRRLGHRFRVEAEARIFTARGAVSDLAAVRRDSFVRLRLGWHW